MSHSPHTAQKHYQFPEAAAKAAMQAHIVKLTKKLQFTEEEDVLLL